MRYNSFDEEISTFSKPRILRPPKTPDPRRVPLHPPPVPPLQRKLLRRSRPPPSAAPAPAPHRRSPGRGGDHDILHSRTARPPSSQGRRTQETADRGRGNPSWARAPG